MGRAASSFALGVGVLVWMPRIAGAAPCPVDPAIGPTSAALDERDPGERADFLAARIETAARRSRIWAASWGAGLGALTIGQLAIAPFMAREERIDFWVGAGASGIGALSRAVFVPVVLRERRRLARVPASASACERLAATERAVAVAARGERQGRALWMHGLNLAYNVGVGLVLGLAFRRPVAGHRLAAMGAVVGEVMIVTQPVVMVRTLEHYRAGALLGPGTWRAHPMVLQGGGGLGLVGAM